MKGISEADAIAKLKLLGLDLGRPGQQNRRAAMMGGMLLFIAGAWEMATDRQPALLDAIAILLHRLSKPIVEAAQAEAAKEEGP